MKIIRTARALRSWRAALPETETLGFVPTMGALHEGHLALVRKAKAHSSKVLVSIFVNPTQFNQKEDFLTYPRTEKDDLKLLRKEQVDAVFIPKSEKEIYPENSDVLVKPRNNLCVMMEGVHRPGHFEGVCTVVLKFFNLITPQHAYFGEKDFQQLRVIECMTEDLLLSVKIVRVKTCRDERGLALSSRNAHLSKRDRESASQMYQILRNSPSLHGARAKLQSLGFGIEYLEIWTPDLESRAKSLTGRWLIAARYRGVRLIDNLTRH